ncbi:phosphotransferase [Alteromonas sp. PRIM-21]|uniref:phosphotransferase n=1 Tax=Alteromonas sp. PRIM-21 TaxID=1454978 RepID=UPI0022B98932|nr:phosphotransferase [Alteromonas sp. PRIM-21]MCZ8528019.1 phosphotransferase [Alteromonas sp. PRIM-21]
MDIIATLQKALNLSGSADVSVHPAGAVNRVYRVQDPANSLLSLNEGNLQMTAYQKLEDVPIDLAVKWLGDDDFSGVERKHQFTLQQHLYGAGIAPQPIWLSDDETIWVEQWESHSASAGLSSTRRPSHTLAETLARIHSLSITARPLNLVARWQHYCNAAKLDTSSDLYLRARAFKNNVIKSEQDDEDSVLCHNDLLINHLLLGTNNSIKVIDWEYAAMGNRYFDLASCCLINKLNMNESEELVAHYANIMNINEGDALNKFKLHSDIVHITNDLWFAALNANKSN